MLLVVGEKFEKLPALQFRSERVGWLLSWPAAEVRHSEYRDNNGELIEAHVFELVHPVGCKSCGEVALKILRRSGSRLHACNINSDVCTVAANPPSASNAMLH